jgi:hypothetical protein
MCHRSKRNGNGTRQVDSGDPTALAMLKKAGPVSEFSSGIEPNFLWSKEQDLILRQTEVGGGLSCLLQKLWFGNDELWLCQLEMVVKLLDGVRWIDSGKNRSGADDTKVKSKVIDLDGMNWLTRA